MKKPIFSMLVLASLLCAKTITIAGTADLQGMLEPSVQKIDIDGDGKRDKVEMGGITHLATLFKELKKENPNTIVVSAGDDLMNRYFHVYKGRAILSLISDAGYDFFAFGNHEFDKGSDVLGTALEGTKFTALCSDLDVSNSALKGKCQPYEIREIDGVKVGFFSLIVENLLTSTSEKKVKPLADNVTNAKKMVKLLKEKGATVVVLVSHIGYKVDVTLAKQVKGIDLIFGGHSHAYMKKIGHIGKTIIVNGGEQGSQVVKVDLPLDENNKVLHKKVTMTKIPVTSDYKADPAIEQKLLAYQEKLPKSIVLGQTKKEWIMDSKLNRKGESTVANMINDLLRHKYKVDIVLNNAGAFRGKKLYPKGDITNTMLKAIDEFGNYAFILTLKGKYIKPLLETSAANYGHGGLIHPSGLKYTIELPKQVQKVKDEKVIQKGKRVTDVKVWQEGKWVEIDETKEYSILTNSFIAQKGGDGFFWFSKHGTNFQNTYATFYSIMSEEVDEKKELTPKEKDGRLVVVH
jgi:5'-nucleotidase